MGHVRNLLKAIPFVRKAWRSVSRSQQYKSLRTKLRVLYTYKRLRPRKLRLLGSDNFIFVDSKDRRGLQIIRGLGKGHQPELRRVWHDAVLRLQPTIVLDVGLNYGEFLFAETYDRRTKVIGIEANDGLQGWIEKSKKIHPNSDQIEIIYALASDRADERCAFYVDKNWSGASSAILPASADESYRREIRSITVDSIFDGLALEEESLLFKIDTEGYEPAVLKGMRRLVGSCKWSLGITEFNSELLRRLEPDLDRFLSLLMKHFSVYSFDGSGRLLAVDEPRFALLQEAYGTSHVVTDLILATDKTVLPKIVTAPEGSGVDLRALS